MEENGASDADLAEVDDTDPDEVNDIEENDEPNEKDINKEEEIDDEPEAKDLKPSLTELKELNEDTIDSDEKLEIIEG